MTPPCKLSAEDIASNLAALADWRLEGEAITRDYRFGSYLAGIDFVVAVAHQAEAMNHHPDLQIGWRKVTVTLSTHSAGGITSLDFDLARRMDSVFENTKA